jgi:hypothetical protein
MSKEQFPGKGIPTKPFSWLPPSSYYFYLAVFPILKEVVRGINDKWPVAIAPSLNDFGVCLIPASSHRLLPSINNIFHYSQYALGKKHFFPTLATQLFLTLSDFILLLELPSFESLVKFLRLWLSLSLA